MKKKLLTLFLAMSMGCFAQAQQAIEGFEGDVFPPEGWTIYDNGVGVLQSWTRINPGDAFLPPYEGDYAAFIDREDVPEGNIAQEWLVTPSVTVAGENPALHFYSRLTLNGDQGTNYMIMLSTGSDPSDLGSYISLQEWTEYEINPQQQEYNEIFVPIPEAYIGQQVYLAFVMEGDNQDRWLIDNVSFDESYCLEPYDVIISDITDTSATVSWTGNGETQWELEIMAADDQPSGSGVIAEENTYTITDIGIGAYKVYLRAICSETSQSPWIGPFYFDNMNSFSGVVNYDSDGDEVCDTPLAGVEVVVTIGDEQISLYTDDEGYYSLEQLEYDSLDVSIQVNAPYGFEAMPLYQDNLDLSNDDATVDFCYDMPDPVTDLAVTLIPTNLARPGFVSHYDLLVKNNGTVAVASATVSITFDDDKLDFDDASEPYTVAGNVLTFEVTDIPALSTKNIDVDFYLLTPPDNEEGDVLTYTSEVTIAETENTPEDNTAVLDQTVVNANDPNDITVHEGDEITIDEAEGYLHYTIRFQNVGTASAVNIKLHNVLDDNFEWDTFEPLASSHDYVVARQGNLLEYRFDEIYLADSTSDEPASHGYVTYRIKPKSSVVLGDTFESTADIYFDFNAAVVTNTANTEIIELLGVDQYTVNNFVLYPNPVSDRLYFGSQNGEELTSVQVYDVNGKLCMEQNNPQGDINVQTLQPGLYFIKLSTQATVQNMKFIKK